MKILMLSQNYSPLIGGIEQHVRALGLELLRRGHEVSIATLWQEGLPQFEIDQGLRLFRIRGTVHRITRLLFINPRRIYAPPIPDPELLSSLNNLVNQENPDIIHAHNWLVHSFLPIKIWHNIPLVVTLHDYFLQCPKGNLMYQNVPCSGPRMVKCLICSGRHYGFIKGLTTVISSRVMNAAERLAADMFIPVSQAVAIGNGLVNSSLPYRVIPNFLPDNVINSTDDSYLSQLPCRDYLLYVGALEKIKGIDVLLRAYGELNNAPPLVLIGYQTSNFQFQVNRNVIVLKNWPNAAVREAMYRSVFTLIPSICRESCPTVAMEAMAMGRPIIASRIGGLTDLVDEGVTGFLVPPGDSNALRQSIELLLANPNLREQMGRAGKNKVVKFQASTVVPRIEDVYNDLVSKPRNYL